jgi:hypothetical protein
LWPTPNAVDVKGPNPLGRRPICDDDLPTRVKRTEWPTPTASEHTGPGHSEKAGGKNLRTGVSERRMWPTPMSAPTSPASHNQFSGQYREALKRAGIPNSGSLNPTWVSKLMGFPADWLDL